MLAVPFATLPAAGDLHLPLVLDKILDNFSGEGDERMLTSLSKSKLVALRHAGTRGWLLGVEIDPSDLLDAEPFLERAKNLSSPASEEWQRIDEAREMAQSDQEVFLKHGAAFTITDVEMVGSYSSGIGSA